MLTSDNLASQFNWQARFSFFFALLLSFNYAQEISYGNDGKLAIISESRNFSVFLNETVHLPCLIKSQTPNTVVIWNQCEDPECSQVRNPITVNKDNFIQDLRFRVLFESLRESIQGGEVRQNDISRHSRSRFRYRDTQLADETTAYGDVNKWTLEIRKFSKKDEGCYQCQLNSFEAKTIYYCLHLQKKVTASPKSLTIESGDDIELKCSTDESVRISSIKWYRNGHRLTHSAFIKIRRHTSDDDLIHSKLTIKKAGMNDSGIYSCKFDHIHARIHVKVTATNSLKNSDTDKSDYLKINDKDTYFDRIFSKSSAERISPLNSFIIISLISIFFSL